MVGVLYKLFFQLPPLHALARDVSQSTQQRNPPHLMTQNESNVYFTLSFHVKRYLPCLRAAGAAHNTQPQTSSS